jgi:hypothetical protein
MSDVFIPNDWQNDAVLDGLDLIDKNEIVGETFRIIGCRFENNKDNVSLCYIDGERTDGTQFTFQDSSSTGVRHQVVTYLKMHELDAGIDTGEYIEFRLVAPKGLRVSRYDAPVRGANGQPIPGKTRPASTFYLTTNGRRGGASASTSTPAVKTPRTRTASK